MTRDQIAQLLDALLPDCAPSAPGADAGYALPDATLRLLTQIVEATGARNVFEFGSGRSTKAFLAAGCAVTAIEDSRAWLDQTLASLTPEEQSRLHPVCQPLRVIFDQGAPFRSWELEGDTLARLAAADLVLIDAPAFPPFREHALSVTLGHCRGGLIVVDDSGIPTVRRFCARLAGGAGTLHRESAIDHGLFFLVRAAAGKPSPRRGLIETAKAWRRFFMAARQPGPRRTPGRCVPTRRP
jgi:hypothetical protein